MHHRLFPFDQASASECLFQQCEFWSSRRRRTRLDCDWSSDVCSSDLVSLSNAMYLTNAVTEVSLADGATLSHLKIQREGMRWYPVGTIEGRQARDSHYQSFSFATGEIGRASCRERGEISGVARTMKKK